MIALKTPHTALACVMLSGGLLLAGCGRGPASDPTAEATNPEAVAVEVTEPKTGEMLAMYAGTASITADRQAFVMPKVRGEIRAVLVEEGDRVAKGQVLARLDGDQLRLEAAQAEANLRKLERDYERNLELQKRGLVSSTAFDNLKFELDAARATYELAALQLSYTSVTTPIAGVVTDKLDAVKVGNTVTPVGGVIESADSAMFVVTDFSSLVVNLSVPEGQLQRLAVGQPAEITLDALPGVRFQGRVSLITPRIDFETATFPVRVEIEDGDEVLRPGMFARVGIVYDRRPNALQIPRSALVDDDGGPRVFVVEGDRALERPLRLGLSSGAMVEVVEGLAPGDRVVVVGQAGLRNESPVRVIDAQS